MLVNPSNKNYEALQKQISNYYTRILIYPFLQTVESYKYWRATSQNLCIPCTEGDKNQQFLTFSDCQKQYGNKLRNRYTWIEDRNEELYQYMKWWTDQSSDLKIRSLTFEE